MHERRDVVRTAKDWRAWHEQREAASTAHVRYQLELAQRRNEWATSF